MKLKCFHLFLAGILISGGLSAEPDSTIRRLMNEPLSMLDWGLYQIDRQLERHEGIRPARLSHQTKHNIEYSLLYTISYLYDSNSINIYGHLMAPKNNLTEKQEKKLCSEAIEWTRGAFGYGSYAALKGGFFSSYFGHNGYQVGDSYPELEHKLAKIVTIKSGVTDANFMDRSSQTLCVGSLLSDDVYFLEN